MNLPKEMATRGLVVSCSQARRLIVMEAVKLNGETVTDLCAEANGEDIIQIGDKIVSRGRRERTPE